MCHSQYSLRNRNYHTIVLVADLVAGIHQEDHKSVGTVQVERHAVGNGHIVAAADVLPEVVLVAHRSLPKCETIDYHGLAADKECEILASVDVFAVADVAFVGVAGVVIVLVVVADIGTDAADKLLRFVVAGWDPLVADHKCLRFYTVVVVTAVAVVDYLVVDALVVDAGVVAALLVATALFVVAAVGAAAVHFDVAAVGAAAVHFDVAAAGAAAVHFDVAAAGAAAVHFVVAAAGVAAALVEAVVLLHLH